MVLGVWISAGRLKLKLHVLGTSLSPVGKFWSPYQGKAQQLQEQRYPFLSMCVVFSCVQTMVWLPEFFLWGGGGGVGGDFQRAHRCWRMRLHTGALRTPQESLHWKKSGRKIPSRTGDSNRRQYCAWLFGGSRGSLYPLSYRRPLRPEVSTSQPRLTAGVLAGRSI